MDILLSFILFLVTLVVSTFLYVCTACYLIVNSKITLCEELLVFLGILFIAGSSFVVIYSIYNAGTTKEIVNEYPLIERENNYIMAITSSYGNYKYDYILENKPFEIETIDKVTFTKEDIKPKLVKYKHEYKNKLLKILSIKDVTSFELITPIKYVYFN